MTRLVLVVIAVLIIVSSPRVSLCQPQEPQPDQCTSSVSCPPGDDDKLETIDYQDGAHTGTTCCCSTQLLYYCVRDVGRTFAWRSLSCTHRCCGHAVPSPTLCAAPTVHTAAPVTCQSATTRGSSACARQITQALRCLGLRNAAGGGNSRV